MTKVATAEDIKTLSTFLDRYSIGMTVAEGSKPAWKCGQRHFRVTLRWVTGQTFDFWSREEPTGGEVLSCLLLDCSTRDNCRDVLDYIDEYVGERMDGKNTQEIRDTWAALGKNRAKVKKLLGADYELLMSLENDL